MNWPVIIIFSIVVITIIVWLVIHNKRDEKVFENQLKNDYPKNKNENNEGAIDEEIQH